MGVVNGIVYNLRGFKLGIRTPRLLMLGMIRFAAVILVTVVSASVVLIYHQELMALIWNRPESAWTLWLWHLVSWMLALALVGISTLLAYLISQILFAVVIMDAMSRITETLVTGRVAESEAMPFFRQFVFLVRQEIPRAILPVLLLLLLTLLGWLTPAGPVLTVVTTVATVVFLAWDNTDLIPARRMRPFSERLGILAGSLPFHLGFGLLFLIPVVNILFLSFAPVGAALFTIEKQR